MFFGVWIGIFLWFGINALIEFIPFEKTWYGVVSQLLLFFVVITPILTFFINQSMRFRRYHSSYRGIRFCFNKNYREAFTCIAGLFILSPLSLFLAYPYFKWRFLKFIYNRTEFGGTKLKFKASLKNLYAIYAKSAILIFIPILFYASISFLISENLFHKIKNTGFLIKNKNEIIFFLFIVFFIFTTYLKITLTNFIFCNIKLGNIRSHSEASFTGLFFLNITNFFMIIFSLGLMIPWATIRTQNFWVESKFFTGDLYQLILTAQSNQNTNSLGDSIADLSGIDIGI